MATLKRQNIDAKILVTRVENWVDDEESSDKEGGRGKCLMAHTNALVIDKESKGSSTFEANISKDAKDSKSQNWDSLSLYQVKKFFTYSDNEKCIMFNYLCHHLSKVN